MAKREDPGSRGGFSDELSELLNQMPTLGADRDPASLSRWYSLVVVATEDQLISALYRQCGDWHLAEDAVQEGFLQGLRQIRKFDPSKATFVGWLQMMSSSRLRDIKRKRNRKSLPFTSTPLASNDPEDGIDPEASRPPFEVREHFGEIFENFIATLSTFDRNLLRFKRAGFTYDEIREVMPTSYSVPTLSNRTRKLIQECRRFWREVNNKT